MWSQYPAEPPAPPGEVEDPAAAVQRDPPGEVENPAAAVQCARCLYQILNTEPGLDEFLQQTHFTHRLVRCEFTNQTKNRLTGNGRNTFCPRLYLSQGAAIVLLCGPIKFTLYGRDLWSRKKDQKCLDRNLSCSSGETVSTMMTAQRNLSRHEW